MIILEREREFVMIAQYDHSLLSGEIAKGWKPELFIGLDRWDDVTYAVSEHDYFWADLDHTPFWDDRHLVPYSFYTFPMVPKLTFYRQGINDLEMKNEYAALLCSLHFSSFYAGCTEPKGKQYYLEEKNRQHKLKQQLQLNNEDDMKKLSFHFQLLQFCDDLSLYVCLNEPGAKKSEEHPWFRNGFSQPFWFLKGNKISACWRDEHTVSLSPFPLEKEVQVLIPFKVVKKERIRQVGIAQSYRESPALKRVVHFVSE